MNPAPPMERSWPQERLRSYAVCALSGTMAGFLFAVCAVLIQIAITRALVTKYVIR